MGTNPTSSVVMDVLIRDMPAYGWSLLLLGSILVSIYITSFLLTRIRRTINHIRTKGKNLDKT